MQGFFYTSLDLAEFSTRDVYKPHQLQALRIAVKPPYTLNCLIHQVIHVYARKSFHYED